LFYFQISLDDTVDLSEFKDLNWREIHGLFDQSYKSCKE
jgi:hypothetical protein